MHAENPSREGFFSVREETNPRTNDTNSSSGTSPRRPSLRLHTYVTISHTQPEFAGAGPDIAAWWFHGDDLTGLPGVTWRGGELWLASAHTHTRSGILQDRHHPDIPVAGTSEGKQRRHGAVRQGAKRPRFGARLCCTRTSSIRGCRNREELRAPDLSRKYRILKAAARDPS